ncbi:UDP-N-acetylmuramate dehydrogenase [Alkaliphilus hydrothermalis]|uniref:UDP-N-acetylenolpyruvoylglucosamine reductase n=1 Tax=Alkaliphilus hydrothermalis TaxID=1482730 RepID=A0ABS2NMT2_9FIRM|nr:UDP-N-acetylmuramate dehydrogenase [Alkaliphilus hydrothermalis]MBM7614217.1 UDP-N-acetylmuramate dehydrogenase [Alkaliphilus hydrothermalis]
MNKEILQKLFLEFMEKSDVLIDEPMKNHTSFKIGGPADVLLKPRSIDDLQKIIKICKGQEAPYFVMGNGSNLLVRDKGLRCVVIKIADNFNDVKFEGTTVKAQAGILLSTLSNKILKESLGGFEFASGIPGTLGGAVTMNAGAYGGEMKDVLKSCRVLDLDGNVLEFTNEELELGYRTSIIQQNGYVVLDVIMELVSEEYEVIKNKIGELTQQRTTKQPLHLPSAGSVFKRPPGYYAGKLIQDSNLRGAKVGGAQISELHCGFIVNAGDATAEDVLSLIELIQKEVKKNFDVDLHTEVKVIGEV